MTRRKVLMIVPVLIGGLAVGILAACPPACDTVEVGPADLRPRIVARALVVAKDGLAEVRARVSGRVRAVHVRPGEAVAAGQLLAELEADDLERALEEAEAERAALEAAAESVAEGARPEERQALEAEVAAASAEVALAEDKETRDARLPTAVSDWQRSQAKWQVELAKARLAAADARLRLARQGGRATEVAAARARAAGAKARAERLRVQLTWTRLVAPVAGLVQARRLDPGDVVHPGPGPALFELADPAATELRVEVEESDAAGLSLGDQVTVTARGGGAALAVGRVSRLAPALERRTIGAEESRVRADACVRAAFVEWTDARPELPIGARLEAVVERAPREVAAALPRAAVVLRGGQALVRLPFGPLWRERAVDLGEADARFVEVRGLEAGARVLLPGAR